MSDYYEEDSFESESDQEGTEEEDRKSKEVVVQQPFPPRVFMEQGISSHETLDFSSGVVDCHSSDMGLVTRSKSDLVEQELSVPRGPNT